MLSDEILNEKLGRKWKNKVPALRNLQKVLDRMYTGKGPMVPVPLSTHSPDLQMAFTCKTNKVTAVHRALQDLCDLGILAKVTESYRFHGDHRIAQMYTYDGSIRL